MISILNKLIRSNDELLSPAPRLKFIFNSMKPSTQSENLSQVVQKSLEGATGTYAVSIKNLKTGESFNMNEHRVFESASLYKLWVMVSIVDQIQKGLLKEDEILTGEVQALNKKYNIASEDAELTEGTVSLTIKDALTQMITISHNYASLLLSSKIGLSNVGRNLYKYDLLESLVGTGKTYPTTTSFDTALFFEKLHKGELANTESTQRMIDLLKKQALNNKLPKYLPSDVVIAHKTGELGYFSHDAGIVFLPDQEYVIAILSQSNFPAGAEDRIANISKNVFEYFQKKGVK